MTPALILDSTGGLCSEVARRWRREGRRVIVVRHSLEPAHTEDEWAVDVTNADTLREVLSEADPSGPINVVHALADRAAGDLPGIEAAHRVALTSLLHLAAILGDRWLKTQTECTLDVLTVGAADLGGEVLPEALVGEATAAFTLSLGYEYPALCVRVTDIDREEAQAVERALSRTDNGGFLALRSGELFRQAVRPIPAPRPEPGAVTELGSGGVHLVTGGLGGVGRHVVDALQRLGDAPIALLQRRRPTEADEAMLRKWNRIGPVRAYQADVTDRDSLNAALAAVRAEFGLIGAVLHVAGVAEDRLAAAKSVDSVERVLAPKVRGAWLLDELTADDPVEAFLLFSSTVAIYGAAGQCDYAAANAFLDAFARFRSRRRGGVTQALDWSVWLDTGMARELPEHSDALRADIIPLTPDSAALALAAAVRTGERRVVIERRRDLVPSDAVLRPAKPRPPAAGVPANRHKLAENVVLKALAALGVEVHTATDQDFFSLGLDSSGLLEMASHIAAALDIELYPTLLFEYPSPADLAAYLSAEHAGKLEKRMAAEAGTAAAAASDAASARDGGVGCDDPVAIVGFAYRFPGVATPADYWADLVAGEVAYAETGELNHRAGRAASGRTHVVGLLDEIAEFDPLCFRIAPKDAALLDPQHRLALECCWRALEHAGHAGGSARGKRAGVFIGVMNSEYETEAVRSGIGLGVATGTSRAILSNMVSYAFDLHGPSVSVETACSSSLVAIASAVNALRTGDADLAVAGGVNILLSPAVTEAYADAGLLSPSGACRPFDKAADGYIRGEGAGMIVLRRLANAVADGDTVYGVIRGASVGHSGRGNGLGAPHPRGQAAVIKAALSAAGVRPSDIGYVETHGTGTVLGDSVEVRGLADALGETGGPCILSSVKGNVGHLESAAGVASLIKVLHCFEHDAIPGVGGFEEPSPLLNLSGTRFELSPTTTPWPASIHPRRALVNSFGFGGTNASVVIEEPPGRAPEVSASPQLVMLSARSPSALSAYQQALADLLESKPGLSLADIAFTLATGREHHNVRFAAVVHSVEQLCAVLRSASPRLLADAPVLGWLSEDSRGAWIELLDGLRNAFLAGGPAVWPAPEPARRIPLPGCPFENERYWLFDKTEEHGASALVLEPRWVVHPRPDAVEPEAVRAVWLLCAESGTDVSSLVRRAQAEHLRCVTVVMGDEYGEVRPDVYAVRRTESDDYEQVLGRLGLGDDDAVRVFLVQPRSRASDDRLTEDVAIACGTLSALFRAMRKRVVHLDAVLFVALEQALSVGGAASDPAGAAVGALARIISQEEPRIRVRVVDVESVETRLAELPDLCAESSRLPTPVAARRGRSWLIPETARTHQMPADDAGPRAWWITGGLGGVGLELAEALAAPGVSIILTSRRQLPDCARWADAAVKGGGDLFERLLALKAKAGELLILSADVTVPEDVGRVARRVRAHCGRGYGIIHAAGAPGSGQRAHLLRPEHFRQASAAKLLGFRYLDEHCHDDDVRCLFVVSSLSALAGGWGFGDYAAANAALDALASARRLRGCPTSVINLGAVDGVGMAANDVTGGSARLAAADLRALLPSVLGRAAPQVIITQDGAVPAGPPAFPQARLAMAGSAAGGGTDDAVEAFWELLAAAIGIGIERLDHSASLPDLGLDSIAQLSLLGEIESRFGVDMPLDVLGAHTSVAEFARILGETVRSARLGGQP